MLQLDTVFAILKVALGFGLVIFIHEFGHFIVARRNGVFVEKFAIGFDFFGAKLATWHRGGTEYVVGAFPVGGYVKMLGQHELPQDEESAQSLDPRSFQAKTVWQRTCIISAGVVANFLSAFALCYIALLLGHNQAPSQVGTVGYEALDAGLRPGDLVTEVAGKSISSWDELIMTYATQEPGSLVPLVYERAGDRRAVSVRVHRDPSLPINTPDFSAAVDLRVGSIGAGLPADLAGLELGDQLLAVDGFPVTSWGEFQRLIQRRPDRDLVLTVGRQDGDRLQKLDLSAHPEARDADLVSPYLLGMEPDHPPEVAFVAAGSPAAVAGMQAGDRVVALGGEPVTSWYALWRRATWDVAEGQPLELQVRRDRVDLVFSVTPGPRPDWSVGGVGLAELGITGKPPKHLVLGSLTPGGPAERAGLKAGDRVTSLRGSIEQPGGDEIYTAVDPSWKHLVSVLGLLAEPRIELAVLRGEQKHDITLELEAASDIPQMGFLGVGPVRREFLVQLGPIEAMAPAVVAPFRLLTDLIAGIRAMFQRRASTKLLAGPVGILQATYSYAEKSTGDLLNFLALLSVNLAVVNFLPIPITDGGHFVFLMYEKLKGRRMDQELEARFQWAGLVFILLVFLFATFNDVGRLLGF